MRVCTLAALAGCANALVRGSFDPLGLAARDVKTTQVLKTLVLDEVEDLCRPLLLHPWERRSLEPLINVRTRDYANEAPGGERGEGTAAAPARDAIPVSCSANVSDGG